MADGDAKGDGRVTIRTVAADSGVSVAAVSKVLRNAYGVSDALRLKVEASISSWATAPRLRRGACAARPTPLACCWWTSPTPSCPIYRRNQNIAATADYKTLLGVGPSKPSIEASLIELMIDNRMDGLILVATRIAGPTLEPLPARSPS